jgi:hypothetical protein
MLSYGYKTAVKYITYPYFFSYPQEAAVLPPVPLAKRPGRGYNSAGGSFSGRPSLKGDFDAEKGLVLF